ncbi:DEKNAAC105391 [Brettanomyces naardenensis]|uniref:Protein-serine/threonine kinase n=1 Tax=Brettanomyces naardenensis TaxID=13370 RepID=A0A448YT97_BRENA|nr:DEKNAAC105391 [Brettanomyces naardenensis]
MSAWKLTKPLRDKIYRYATVKQTGVSLRQMTQFGSKPSQGSLFHASHFAVHELPIRLSHRVKDLETLPNGLAKEPAIQTVRNWYAQSFEELTSLPEPEIADRELEKLLSGEKQYEETEKLLQTPPSSASSHGREFEFSDDGIVIKRHPKEAPEETVDEVIDLNPAHRHIGLLKPRRSYYISTPKELVYPQEVLEYNKLVTKTLTKIKRRHDATVATIARGVQSWKRKNNFTYLDNSVNQFLDKFYLSRIGIRMLIGQTIALNQQAQGNMYNDDYVGIICLRTNVMEIVQDAIDAARFACEEHYDIMEAPPVQLYCPEDLEFMYVPGHLVHMIFETLKNSLRATIEFQQRLHPDTDIEDITLPPIKIIVAEGLEDITIKVSDEGGGIPRSAIPLVWTYFYTSAEQKIEEYDPSYSSGTFKPPFMGLGVGLPHSRLYARYFSGDLKLISMEGYGTDVYLHLSRLSSSSEPLQ